MEFAICRLLSEKLTGKGECAEKCEFPKPRKAESHRQLSKLTKELLTGALQSVGSNSQNLLANSLLLLLEAPADAKHLLCSVREGLSAFISAKEQPR